MLAVEEEKYSYGMLEQNSHCQLNIQCWKWNMEWMGVWMLEQKRRWKEADGCECEQQTNEWVREEWAGWHPMIGFRGGKAAGRADKFARMLAAFPGSCDKISRQKEVKKEGKKESEHWWWKWNKSKV
jgi:hypothetical protein